MSFPRLRSSSASTCQRRARMRPLQILEALEDKVLLSNVTVRVGRNGSKISIKGDSDDNAIRMSRFSGESGQGIVIESLNGETINGESSPFLILVEEDVGNVKVNLGDGDDDFAMESVNTRGSVTAKGGSGNDRLIVYDSIIGGNLKLSSSSGADDVGVIYSDIARGLKISTGSDRDKVLVADDTFVGGKASIKTASGDDDVMLVGSEFAGNVTLNTGSGADHVLTAIDVTGKSVAKLGSGDDIHRVVLDDAGESLLSDGGRDNDTFSLEVYDGLALVDTNARVKGHEDVTEFEGEGSGNDPVSAQFSDVIELFECMESAFPDYLRDSEPEGPSGLNNGSSQPE